MQTFLSSYVMEIINEERRYKKSYYSYVLQLERCMKILKKSKAGPFAKDWVIIEEETK